MATCSPRADRPPLWQVLLPEDPLDAAGYCISRIMGMAGGALVGLAAVAGSSTAVTACADGSVRAFDYRCVAAEVVRVVARGFPVEAWCLSKLVCLILNPPLVAAGQPRCCNSGASAHL